MNSSDQSIFNGLNEPQREAVSTLNGPLLILAGAGSGKTRVVTRRVANLIANGVRPWEILAITFTNKAAGEMRRRVEDLVGASGTWVATFHSFCARLLRREAAALGLTPEFTIYDEDDVSSQVKDILKALALSGPRFTPRQMRQAISGLKSKGLAPDDLDGVSHYERILQEVYTRYEAGLQRNMALDFDDLLLKGMSLLRDHEAVREKYRRRFKYLLVDEYQDTNGCQYELVKLLGAGHRNVCATGDPDQSIYAWRGADVRNILSFEKDFPEAKVVRLEENYRSTGRILAVASAVIKHNTERKDKELWTRNPEGERIKLVIAGDEQLEAWETASRIGRLLREGVPPKDIAIFYRTNSQSRPFETALLQAALPYRLVGGTPFYERKEVKDALSYLRLIVNPKDDAACARIINVPRRGIGPGTVEVLSAKAKMLGVSMLEALDQPGWMETELKPKARQELWKFAKLLDKLKALPQVPVRDALVAVLDETDLLNALEQEGETERVQNLEELVNAANAHDEEHRQNAERIPPPEEAPEPGAFDGEEEFAARRASIAGFLENAALIQSTDALKSGAGGAAGEKPPADFAPTDDRLTLMTLHMAKGLEFPHVFLAGMEEGLLPMTRSGGSSTEDEYDPAAEDRAVEEERRLFYVGVTRAQTNLTLLRTVMRMRFGKTEISVPSRFLDEIPEMLLDTENKAGAGSGAHRGSNWNQYEKKESRWGEKSKRGGDFDDFDLDQDEAPKLGSKSAQSKFSVDADYSSQLDDGELTVGDRVSHAKFGEGVVESLSGLGLSRKATVRFRAFGVKQLLVSLAKLQKK